MKLSKPAFIALILWLATISVAAWYFIHGNTTQGNDGRTAIVLQAVERDFVLTEMRGLLSATQGILEGVSMGDRQLVITAAHQAGMAGAADVNPALMTKLPLQFKSLGMSVHHDMDEIAQAAAANVSNAEMLKMTSNTLTKCVACHSAWQLRAEKSAN